MNTDIRPVLELSGLGVSFGQRVVLDNISISLPPDGIDVLMGPVKSGKSTLLRTLAGRFEGHSLHRNWGDVQIAGRSSNSESRPALVQQHASAYNLSLLNALLQPVRLSQQRSSIEWRNAGLVWLSEHGLGDHVLLADQPLSQCDAHLQRSVLILAQVLLKPPILLIDEPTYGLDDVDATWLVDWLKRLSAHCKLWVCLHNQLHARRLADRIVLIGGGRVLAHQETTQFFQHPANEWVEQFVRTGSLSLPSPGAQAQDLEADTPVPPPLSDEAQKAIQAFSLPPAPVEVDQPPTRVAVSVTAEPSVDEKAAVEKGVVMRKPVILPSPSRDGVELASGVGEMIFRDSSGPRGFHWIVPGKLAGCPAPGVSAPIDYDLNLLARAGISKLITLTETDLDQKALRRHFLTNTHLSIFDREAPSIAQTHMLLVRMQIMIESGQVLAVHCKAGLGRTGTILAAWLIRDGGLTADVSITRLRKIDPGYIQSSDQEDFLHRYEADIVRRLV